MADIHPNREKEKVIPELTEMLGGRADNFILGNAFLSQS
jgi:hypothetical protein